MKEKTRAVWPKNMYKTFWLCVPPPANLWYVGQKTLITSISY